MVNKIGFLALLLGTATWLCGCQPAAPEQTPPAVTAEDEFDPCAERLHDLCGAMLMYYVTHDQVPSKLADLGRNAPPPVCPKTGQRFVYDPQGIEMPGGVGTLIVYETKPCGKTCLAILAEPHGPTRQLVLRVVHVPPGIIPDMPPAQPRPAAATAPAGKGL